MVEFSFVNLPWIIVSLSAVSHKCDVTERMTSFTGIYLHVIILSGINRIQHRKEYLRDDVVSNNIGVCSSKSTLQENKTIDYQVMYYVELVYSGR